MERDAAVPAYIALGSNLGDRERRLEEAVRRIGAFPGTEVRAASPVYESAAHTLGGEEQPAYLNQVVCVETRLAPEALLAACQEAERQAGRVRAPGERWAARTLDLDVIVYGGLTRAGEPPVLPHPRLAGRRFVLQPLADLAPDLRVPPPFDRPVRELLAACPDPNPVRRVRGGFPEPRNA